MINMSEVHPEQGRGKCYAIKQYCPPHAHDGNFRNDEEHALVVAFNEEFYEKKFNIRDMNPDQAGEVYDALMKENHHHKFGCKAATSKLIAFLSPDGNLRRYFLGRGLKMDTVEVCMNTMTLVNALVLTIPYGFVGNLNSAFWDDLKSSMETYGCDEYFYSYYYNMRNDVMAVTYSSIAAIVIAVFFYILKADFKDEEPNAILLNQVVKTLEKQYALTVKTFDSASAAETMILNLDEANKQIEKSLSDIEKRTQLAFYYWWRDGRWVVLICFILTSTAVLALLCLSYLIFSVFAVPSGDICKFYATPNSCFAIAVAGSLLVVCIKKMM